MQPTDLKFPGGFTSAQTIRREVAHEISQLQISAASGSPVDPSLAAFLADAAAKTPGYVPPEAPPLPATQALVDNTQSVVLRNSANTAAAGAAGVAIVASNVLTVRLPSTSAVVTSGLSTVAATGTGTKVTFTVASGVITAITLSA